MALRVAFPLVLQSPSSGSAIVGATATITQHVVGASLGSGSPATIYTSEVGAGTVVGNQIVTDNTGRWTQGGPGYAQYWLAAGTYDIVVSGVGLTAYTITRELTSAGTPPWVAMTMGAGVTTGGSGNTASVRLEGADVVRMKGVLINSSGSAISYGTPLATFPIGFVPLNPPFQFVAALGSHPTEVSFSFTACTIILATGSLASSEVLVLDGWSYTQS